MYVCLCVCVHWMYKIYATEDQQLVLAFFWSPDSKKLLYRERERVCVCVCEHPYMYMYTYISTSVKDASGDLVIHTYM